MTTTKRDPRLPFTTLDEGFLAPRDPVLGLVKIGGKDQRIRFARATGRPWVAPTRFVDPPRFEVTTREKVIKEVEGQGKAKGEKFKVDLGYHRDLKFHQEVGEKPTTLRIRLLYPTWQENLISFLGAYSGSEWTCRGNGLEAIDVKRGEVPCPCPRLKQFAGVYEGPPPNDAKRPGETFLLPCKPHGQLNMLLEDAEVFGGFHVFKTTSYESISNLMKALQIFEQMFGRLDGLPLELRVMAATKSYGEGTTTQPIVTIVLPASMNTARQVAADAAAESRKYLPAGRGLDAEEYREAVVTEMEQEAQSYAGEFIPESQVDAEELAEADAGPDGEPGPKPEPEAEPEPGPREGEDYEIVGAGPEDDESEEDEPDGKAELERICRAVLKHAGWKQEAIDSRVAYHIEQRTLDTLAEGLEKHMADAWAAVHEPGYFDGDAAEGEPQDGLQL
jgi:hypothetical protein